MPPVDELENLSHYSPEKIACQGGSDKKMQYDNIRKVAKKPESHFQ